MADRWTDYNADLADRHVQLARLAPDAEIRFDFAADGWGCSVVAGGIYFPGTGTAEVYGDGDHPLAAMDAALVQLQLLAVVG